MYQQTDLLDALAPGRVEDFITNAFCWLLSNTVCGKCFIDYLGSLGSGDFKLPELDGNNLRWETQTQFPRGDGYPVRPDMTCTDKESQARDRFRAQGVSCPSLTINNWRTTGTIDMVPSRRHR